MIKNIKKLAVLSIHEIYLLIIAFLFLFTFKLFIKILPFNFLQKKFQKWVQSENTEECSELEIKYKALAINRISYAFPVLGFTCLPKALAMKYWLRTYKHIALNFGVQKDNNNNFVAHAWITQSNKTILGDDPSINYKSIWVWE